MEKVDIEKIKGQFEEASRKFYECMEIRRKVHEISLETIKAVLSETDGNNMDLDDDNMMSVSYDGGNHPEYASNVFSMIYSVYLKNGEIFLNIQDCDEYEIDRVDYDDVFAIAEVLVKQRQKQ